MRRVVRTSCVAGIVLLMGSASVAGPPPGRPPADPVGQGVPAHELPSDAVVEAHRSVDTARLKIRYTPYYTYPDETVFKSAEYRVVFDRRSDRIRIDRPGFTLVCDGTDIVLIADAIEGRHLRVPLNGPLSYARLLEVMPGLADPMPPGLVWMLADPPMAWLSAGQAAQATAFTPKHDQADERIHLRLPTQLGHSELRFDGETNLLDEMVVFADRKQLAGSGLEDLRFYYDVTWESVGEPIDDSAFELDLEGSAEAATMAQLLAAPAQPQQTGPTLIGLSMPEIELAQLEDEEATTLSELDEGVVILEFFATWTRASVLDLPALAEFERWCDEAEYDVAVYAVAVGNKSKAVKQWLDALEQTAETQIDLPVLLDQRMDVAMALKLPTLPRTLVLVDGQVVEVFGGVKPTFLEDLQAATPGWLEQVESESE